MIKFDKIFKKDKFGGICILPIGRDCHNSMMLRRLGIRKYSYPMDWINYCDEKYESLETRINFLINGFKNFINLEDFYTPNNEISGSNHIIYLNKYTGFRFGHDFKVGVPIERQYKEFKKKYNKRIKRLISHLNSAKIIKLIYISNTWDHMSYPINEISITELEILNYRLRKRFPQAVIEWHIFEHDSSKGYLEYYEEKVGNIHKYFSNHSIIYNSEPLGMVLSIEKILTEKVVVTATEEEENEN